MSRLCVICDREIRHHFCVQSARGKLARTVGRHSWSGLGRAQREYMFCHVLAKRLTLTRSAAQSTVNYCDADGNGPKPRRRGIIVKAWIGSIIYRDW